MSSRHGESSSVLYGADQVTLQVAEGNSLAADFDEDGDVDGDDLTRCRSGFRAGTTHMQGNADGDPDVDGADFLVWQRQLGSVSSVAAAVPEPSAGMLLLLGYAGARFLVRNRLLCRKVCNA
jgi:hypothetical protein